MSGNQQKNRNFSITISKRQKQTFSFIQHFNQNKFSFPEHNKRQNLQEKKNKKYNHEENLQKKPKKQS